MIRAAAQHMRRISASSKAVLAALACVAALCTCMALAGCQSNSKTVLVGVRTDVAGMSSMDSKSGVFSGLEVDIANEVFKRVYGNDAKVVFVGVSGDTRESMLDNESVDALLACYTITDDRKLRHNISQPYHSASTRIMVNSDSGYGSIADLTGRTVGVLAGSTNASSLQAYAQSQGVTLFTSDYETYLQIKDGLSSGIVSGFCTDDVILAEYLDGESALLPDSFSKQEYGVVTRLDDTSLANSIDDALTAMKNDGALASLEAKWNV